MAKPRSQHKLIRIQVGLDEHEYDFFFQSFSKTPYRHRSEYARMLLTGKPITVNYRDQSFDEFLELGIQLKKKLNLLLTQTPLSGVEMESISADIKTIKEHLIKLYDYYVSQYKSRQ